MVHGVTELDMIEYTHTHTHTHKILKIKDGQRHVWPRW